MKIQPEGKTKQAQGRSPFDLEKAADRPKNSVRNLGLLCTLSGSLIKAEAVLDSHDRWGAPGIRNGAPSGRGYPMIVSVESILDDATTVFWNCSKDTKKAAPNFPVPLQTISIN